MQIIIEKGLFNNYDNADESLKIYLLFEVNETHLSDLNPINDDGNVKRKSLSLTIV